MFCDIEYYIEQVKTIIVINKEWKLRLVQNLHYCKKTLNITNQYNIVNNGLH